jgi:hypothetical protein
MTGSLKVCVVGAGPAGLAMGRALKQAGIAFDIFEKNPGVGGIWNPAFAGSPMYDSAHFISSKTAPTSTYEGHAFPDSAAIYPSHAEVLAYLEAFARNEGLMPHIHGGTPVDFANRDDYGDSALNSRFFRPRFPAFSTRPVASSICFMKLSLPMGRPLVHAAYLPQRARMTSPKRSPFRVASPS